MTGLNNLSFDIDLVDLDSLFNTCPNLLEDSFLNVDEGLNQVDLLGTLKSFDVQSSPSHVTGQMPDISSIK